MSIDFLRECIILQDYVTLYTLDKYDVCGTFYILEVGIHTLQKNSSDIIVDISSVISRLYHG